jgi:hypothetical protein
MVVLRETINNVNLNDSGNSGKNLTKNTLYSKIYMQKSTPHCWLIIGNRLNLITSLTRTKMLSHSASHSVIAIRGLITRMVRSCDRNCDYIQQTREENNKEILGIVNVAEKFFQLVSVSFVGCGVHSNL